MNNGYILAELGHKASRSGAYTGGNVIACAQTFDAIDLTKYGYPADGSIIESGKLALSIDLFFDGDETIQKYIRGDNLGGQFEITSSGTCDVQERCTMADALKVHFGGWLRQTVDLSLFNLQFGDFDPKNFIYSRLYFGLDKYEKASSLTAKLCNVWLVDLTKEAPSFDERPLGDGSFEVEPPVWRVMDVPAGFDNGETIVAGYNLKEYVESHRDVPEIARALAHDDWAPIIQNLCDALTQAKGGALYIPSGVYSCRSEIVLKKGVLIYGDWKNPEECPETTGTVLAVYAGKNSVNGSPFIQMGSGGMIKYLNFWYPEQGFTADTVIPYTATVGLTTSAWVEKCTFLNSYLAIKNGPNYVCAPNSQDIYVTPLWLGLDFSFAIDFGRMENFFISPKYWPNCGLPGAPKGEAEAAALKEYLYQNATGVICGRIDWSLITYIYVEGYHNGVVFDHTPSGNPNGQNTAIRVRDCCIGLRVRACTVCAEMVANSTIQNCEYGVYFDKAPFKTLENWGHQWLVQLLNVDINATRYALYSEQRSMIQMLSCTVKNGAVLMKEGWLNAVNTTFATPAPQIVLDDAAEAANLLGCSDAAGNPIVIENRNGCTVINDPEKADVADIPTIEDNEGLDRELWVPNKTFYLVDDLPKDGVTDVTAALQQKLDTAAKNGGGIVFLVTGSYCVNGTITIPTGVELRGPHDVGTLSNGDCGANLYIYRTTDLQEPTVVMQAGSGLRGLGFEYPEQGHNDDYKAGRWTEYPYAVQGRGSDIYIINVDMHNVWNGVDMMTYRCDNHYVDYLGGQCLNNLIQVGGGSQNGIVRNYHINPNAIRDDYTGKGFDQTFEHTFYDQLQNEAVVMRVGHVENEIVFDGVNYSGYVGIQIMPEESGKADVRLIGCAMDYTTVPVQVIDAKRVDILNLQMVSFNFKLGEDLKREMRHIVLEPTNTCTVNVAGIIFWENSKFYVDVQNGTLNLYGFHDVACEPAFARVSKTGTVNAWAMYTKRAKDYFGEVMVLGEENLDRVHINSGFYLEQPIAADKVGTFKNMLRRTLY